MQVIKIRGINFDWQIKKKKKKKKEEVEICTHSK